MFKRTPVDQLRARAAIIKAWLGDRLHQIQVVRKGRDAELANRRADIDNAVDASGEHAQAASELQEQAAQLRRRAKELEDRAGEEQQAAAVYAVEAEHLLLVLDEARLRWKDELRKVQDGRVRRKRHELVKLQERIDRKDSEEAARANTHINAEDIMYGKGLPQTDYGTAKPAAGEPAA